MTGTATITFSQTGVQSPVYVVTSLSSPPWETLEMRVSDEQTASANLIFTKQFEGVAEGSYQYKIRIGEGHWVVDESQESATDEHGNRNNVVQVKAASEVDSSASTSGISTQDATSDVTQQKTTERSLNKRKDSSVDHMSQPSVPIPFVVVEKVADQQQPEYGDVEPESLPSDVAKRTADAEPDVEEIRTNDPVEVDPPKTPEVPLIVVEKTDDELSYGEDFGEHATIVQKVAHDMRAADASPDKLIISPEPQAATGNDDEQAAPLLPHETFQADNQSPASPLDVVDDESTQSSTDQTSSTEVIHTPSEQDDSQDDDELSHGPLLTHETGFGDRNGELNNELLLAHEAGLEEEALHELNGAPLMPHETNLDDDDGAASDDEDEFGRAPLLPHETGFADYNGRVVITNGDQGNRNEAEYQHYDPYDDEDEDDNEDEGDLNGDYDDTPLLPHERDSAIGSNAGSELSADDAHYILHGRPSFGHETDNAKELFRGNTRPNFFRTQSNSSTLPHELPRSDAEDENLNDPLLERFPTSRDRILERVATIGLQLPEDHPVEDSLHSPQLSVLSQACSSVDLVPVKSYVSLASVPEADDIDEEDEDDVDSISSPMLIGARHSSDHTRDQHTAAVHENSGQLDLPEAKLQTPSAHTAESSEAESVSKTDGSKDNTLSILREAIATPSNVLNPIASTLTPEGNATATREGISPQPESQLHQRRSLKDDSPQTTQDPPVVTSEEDNTENKAAHLVKPAPAQPNAQNEPLLQTLIRVLCGSVGRFLTACIGDRKRASTTAVVVGVAVAAYYLFSFVS